MNWLDIKNAGGIIKVSTRRPEHTVNPLRAAIDAVHDIVEHYPAPYTLMLSGGVDSQAMLWAWIVSGVEFKTLTAHYNQYLNEHDQVQLVEFTQRHSIPLGHLDLDVLSFLDAEYQQYANKYRCASPQICTHMKIADSVEKGTVILSGNFMSKEGPRFNYTILGLQRYASESGKSVVPFFFLQTKDLAFAFQNYDQLTPTMTEVQAYAAKVQTYQQAGFPVIAQAAKYTGFEHIKTLWDQTRGHQVTQQQKLKYAKKHSRRAMDILLRYPYEEQFGNPEVEFSFKE